MKITQLAVLFCGEVATMRSGYVFDLDRISSSPDYEPHELDLVFEMLDTMSRSREFYLKEEARALAAPISMIVKTGDRGDFLLTLDHEEFMHSREHNRLCQVTDAFNRAHKLLA